MSINSIKSPTEINPDLRFSVNRSYARFLLVRNRAYNPGASSKEMSLHLAGTSQYLFKLQYNSCARKYSGTASADRGARGDPSQDI